MISAFTAGGTTIRAATQRLAVLVVAGLLAGCCTSSKPAPVPEPLSRQEAIQTFNAQAGAVPAFKASIRQWEAQFVDTAEDKTQHFQELGGKLYYRPPSEPGTPARFYLQANAPFQDGWVVGSNQDEYWMYSQWGKFGGWGKYEYFGRPCARSIPIHPQTLLEFVGLLPIPDEMPYPLYKVMPETHVLEYIALMTDGYVCRRQIVVDRRSNLPRQINAFDADGRMILHSELSNYQELESVRLPGDIYLAWPQNDSFVHLKLDGFKVDPTQRDRLFTRPQRIAEVEDYRQIDQECESTP
ncbi:MAG: hypothetical protein JW810_01315 [Sedimentisphaerales bacterium]|nr:hypothetical protein [Sedimentisphaerales bacterium]